MAASQRDLKRTSGPGWTEESRSVGESALTEPGRTAGSAEGERGTTNSSAQGEPGRTPGSAEGGREVVESALSEPGHTSSDQSADTVYSLTPTKTVFDRDEAESLHEQGAEAVFVVLESLSQEIVQLRNQVKELRRRLKDKG